MPTLRSLVDTLGTTLIEVLHAPGGLDVPVRRLVVSDPDEALDVEPGDVVLGVGAGRGRDVAHLLRELSASGAAALVIKGPEPRDPGVVGYDRAGGAALLAVPRRSAWAQVVQLLGTALASAVPATGDERLAGAQGGDLFAIANVVAELVDGPVTIEDSQSRVVAYSGRQDEADDARITTVLGRHVPAEWRRRLEDLGVYERLAVERAPLYLDRLAPELMPRLAVAVRAGDEVLGSIWAAVRERPAAEIEQALADAAGFVALHLLRHRLTSDVRHGLERELVTALLDGGTLAADAADRLGIAGAAAYRVVAVGLPEAGPGEGELVAARCRDILAVHLGAVDRGARTVLVDGVVYALVPVPRVERAQPAAALLDQLGRFVARVDQTLRTPVLAGVGLPAATVADITAARATADEALRLLRREPWRGPVAGMEQLRSTALLHRFAEMCAADPLAADGPLRVLRDHDARRSTGYVRTLRAYLDAFGDVEAVAADLRVHANTVRYRLRQLQAVAAIDLRNPTDRLALMLELRIGAADDAGEAVQEVANPLVSDHNLSDDTLAVG